jgi:hypothetical protein
VNSPFRQSRPTPQQHPKSPATAAADALAHVGRDKHKQYTQPYDSQDVPEC